MGRMPMQCAPVILLHVVASSVPVPGSICPFFMSCGPIIIIKSSLTHAAGENCGETREEVDRGDAADYYEQYVPLLRRYGNLA